MGVPSVSQLLAGSRRLTQRSGRVSRDACARLWIYVADEEDNKMRLAEILLVATSSLWLAACGSDDSPRRDVAVMKFCNDLNRNDADFTAYLTIQGEGTNVRLEASTGECSACTRVTGGVAHEFEMGDELDWLVRWSQTLTTNEHYDFITELDDTGFPDVAVFRIISDGGTCSNVDPFE
jgi:hypothetical protein